MTEAETPKQTPDFKDVENGPLTQANRECRDVLCCLIFLINIVAMVYCGIHGISTGKPTNIYRATSAIGQICGEVGGAAETYPYVYFYNPLNLNLLYRTCVRSCPTFVNGTLETLTCTSGTNCTYSIVFNTDGTVSTTPTGTSFLGYQTQPFLDRVCVPSTAVISNGLSAATSFLSSAFSQGYLGDFILDIKNNWQWLLAALGISIVISFVFMFSLRWIAGIVVWVSIFGTILVFSAMGLIFLYNAGIISSSVTTLGSYGLPVLSDNGYFKYYGYASFGIAGFLLLLTLCCCSRIRLAVAVCNCAGQFIARTCQVMLVPIVMTTLIGILWAACLVIMIYLVSMASYKVSGTDVFTSISSYQDNNLIRFYYFVFATLWSNALLQAMTTFVVASSCCMWYYSHGPGQDLDFPVLRSYKMIFRYHFGSFAFGSFILAVVQFLQLMVEIFKKQAQNTGADQNKFFEYLINCLRCCLACVERIVQFINKTAYIQIAIRGKNFCMAAKDGFQMVWSNPLRYGIVAGLGEIMMFIGKLLIASATTAIFYVIITYISSIKSNILQPLFLLLVVFIIAFAIGMVFMSVYNVSMDTLLACFIVDETNQKARGGTKAAYAPQQLACLMDD